jgi:hypothetical protein
MDPIVLRDLFLLPLFEPEVPMDLAVMKVL